MTAINIIGAADLAALLQPLHAEMAAIRARLDAVAMTPQPDWMNVKDYARRIGKSPQSVKRYVAAGELETKRACGVLMIRV